MTTRSLLFASLVAATTLLVGCNGNGNGGNGGVVTTNPTNPPPPMTISQLAASLIAGITGSACNTATPTTLDSVTLTDDMAEQNANALTVNCTS